MPTSQKLKLNKANLAYLASINTNVNARRAARAHLLFNMMGVLWMLLFFEPFVMLVDSLWPGSPNDPDSIYFHLSVFHTLFNITNTLLLVGFIPFIWLYASFLKRGFTHWLSIREPKLRAVVLGFTLAVLGQAISNIVVPNFFQSWSLVVFAIAISTNELIYRWEQFTENS